MCHGESLRAELEQRDALVAAIYNSPSWRMSAPLRALKPLAAHFTRPRPDPVPPREPSQDDP